MLKEDHRVPKIALQLWVGTGSALEEKWVGCGLSHFFEHFLFRSAGTDSLWIELAGAGGWTNAHTSQDRTYFEFEMDRDHWDRVSALLANVLHGPQLDPIQFEQEKEVILREMDKNLDNPWQLVSNLYWQVAYEGTPYQYPVIGYRSKFQATTPKDMRQYFEERYVPRNMVLVAVGDFEAAKLYTDIKQKFGILPKAKQKSSQVPPLPDSTGFRLVIRHNPKVNGAYAQVGFRVSSIENDDVPALDVLANVLRNPRSEARKLMEDRGGFAISGVHSYTPEHHGVFYLTLTAPPDSAAHLHQSLLAATDSLKTATLDSLDIVKAKVRLKTKILKILDTNMGQAMALGTYELYLGDANRLDAYLRQLDAVTPEMICTVLGRYFRKDNATVVVLASSEGYPSYEDPEQFNKTKDRVVDRTVFPNGVTLLFKHDPSTPFAFLVALYEAGILLEDAAHRGASHLSGEAVMRQAGLFRDRLDEVGGEVTSCQTLDGFGLQIKLPAEQVQIGFDLLKDAIRASLPDGLWEEMKAQVVRRAEWPLGPFESLRQALYGTHPYGARPYGTAESASKLSKEAICAWRKRYAVPGRLIVVAWGDLDQETIFQQLGECFRTHPWIPVREVSHAVYEPRGIQRVALRSKESERQARLLLGFVVGKGDTRDRFTWEILCSILRIRLGLEIRNRLGMAYHLGVWYEPMQISDIVCAMVVTTPQMIDQAEKEIREEIHKIRTQQVSANELAIAQRAVIGREKGLSDRLEDEALSYVFRELEGIMPMPINQFEAQVNKVTASDVQQLAQRYLIEDRCAIVVQKP